MKRIFLVLLGIYALSAAYAQSNDTLTYYIKLIDSNLNKKETSETINFDNVKFDSKYEAPLLNYVPVLLLMLQFQ